jgi:hypothetical protein
MSNYLYDSLEMNATINYINRYYPVNLTNFFFESDLIKHNDLINSWTYVLIIKKTNKFIKKFIEKTYIGLPIELNRIIANFIPDYKEVKLKIDIKAENALSRKLLWNFNSIECNLFDIQKSPYKNIEKVVKLNISDFLNKKTVTKYCPCRELTKKNRMEMFERSHYEKCDGSIELKKYYSEHFLLDHIVNNIKDVI